MGFNNFALLILLFTSGFLLCTTQSKKGDEGRIKRPVIGIHLGTTYSSVGVRKNSCIVPEIFIRGRSPGWWYSDIIEVVMNEQGHRTTPSCVAFTDSGVLIGEAAKDQAAFNSERTICCEILRLIGKKFDDPEVQSLVKRLPYKVVNIENKPHIQLKFKNDETKVFSPEEICAMLLGKMKEITEAYVGKQITHAAVAVPTYFDTELRQHIEDAGKMVGLDVVRVSKSRIAAAVGFGFNHRSNIKCLIYDLGGSAFDASLLVIDAGGGFELIAARGDLHLGGKSFDTRVADHFINLIKSKYKKDISKDIKALGRLRSECEKAKMSLSSRDQVMIKIESLTDGIELFEEPLTRVMFEELNMDLFNKTIDVVKGVMEEGGVEKKNVDEIFLVGGSTRVPKIQQMLKELFGKEPLNNVNPDEVLAYGATMTGGFLGGEYRDGLPVLIMNTMSVGIETVGGVMTQFVKSNECLQVPKKMSRNVTTYHDGQTTIEIIVFEGERPLTRYGHYLGRLELSGLPPAPRGVPTIEVTIEVDSDLNIHVTAEDKATQKKKSITIPAGERYDNDIMEWMDAFSDYFRNKWKDAMEKNRIEAAMMKLPPQAYNKRFAVVNKED